MNSASPGSDQPPSLTRGIAGLGERVCRYFLDFLETDFKRQQAPRRRIQGRTADGQTTSINLRKYRKFSDEIWTRLRKPLKEGTHFTVERSAYTAPLNPILQDLIRKHVAAIEDRLFDETITVGIETAKKGRGDAGSDIEKYVDGVLDAIGTALDKRIIAPLLALLDEPIKKQAYSAVDSIFEIETDIVEVLIRGVDENLAPALTSFVVTGDAEPIEATLRESLAPSDARERLIEYIESIATSDLYQDFRDLHNFLRTQETASFYLYVCDLRFESHLYPLVYVPIQVEFEKESGRFNCVLDPHLYVNKRAVDFVLGELGKTLGKMFLTPIDERILYLDETKPILDEIERVINRVQSVLSLDDKVDVRAREPQAASSSTLRLTTALYVAVFDKSDESLLNDYEALLSAMHTNEAGVASLFQRLVQSCILEDPLRVIEPIQKEWDGQSIPNRLVAQSPIPLNEEQRKLLLALKDPKTTFAIVHGPPGTGKSHTITAIAFDCILEGRNVLVLSDKQEALDVVEDKLTVTLKKVRVTEDFQNPILRLGRNHGTYTKLLSSSTLDRIRQHHRAERKNAENVEREIVERDAALKSDIDKTVKTLSSVRLADVEVLHQLEAEIEKVCPGVADKLQDPELAATIQDLKKSCEKALTSPNLAAADQLIETQWHGRSVQEVELSLKVRTLIARAAGLQNEPLHLFDGLDPARAPALEVFLAEYRNLRMPVFGYLFRRGRLAELNRRFLASIPCQVTVAPQKSLPQFEEVLDALHKIGALMQELRLPAAAGALCFDELRQGQTPALEAGEILHALSSAVALAERLKRDGGALGPDLRAFQSLRAYLGFLAKVGAYAELWASTRATLEAVPNFDAVASRATLEKLYTQKMADRIDGRFIEFVDRSNTTAKALASVIRGKKQFPTEDFDHLKSAFPCIIAGIREFAEYIPLKSDLFDVVIIDEASQVSVAQAFPALMRAKKVVVFGDPKQFSNVKSMNASNALNNVYLTDIQGFFRANVSDSAQKLVRLSRFDVKRSILEFFDLVANYEIMLKKHFRGYQELISFSSRHFYDGALQAIKVRGRPVDEVIEFTVLDKATETQPIGYRNVNKAECEFIRSELDELVQLEVPPTVGIITPFREQVQYLTKELFRSANADHYESKLRLKVMTFDTCQGEERDVIYYSMVASDEHDALNYIFPVDLVNAPDRVEETLKMQRLNVGFSRAKECIHFVLSKPIDDFRGSIGRALQHYKAVLDRDEPTEDEVDPSSPMEKKVLDWILKSPFYQRHGRQVELIPQYPIGEYLKQLDPYYVHPNYRVDFLLRYRTVEDELLNIVVEYDGFQEHFIEHGKVHDGNWDWYYRPEDVERQMILESYGYKFLRINRFNLGKNPPESLSERLYGLIEAAHKEERSGAIDRIHEQVEGQQNGSWKVCGTCHGLKPLEDFFDKALRKGAGGHGRICAACKDGAKAAKSKSSASGRSYRRWRRRRWT